MLRDGSRRRVGNVRIPLARVAHLRVRSRNGGYVVLPWRRPRGATVHLLHPRAQSSAPLAGPDARGPARCARAAPGRRSFSARYAPVERERAAETAARSAKDR